MPIHSTLVTNPLVQDLGPCIHYASIARIRFGIKAISFQCFSHFFVCCRFHCFFFYLWNQHVYFTALVVTVMKHEEWRLEAKPSGVAFCTFSFCYAKENIHHIKLNNTLRIIVLRRSS